MYALLKNNVDFHMAAPYVGSTFNGFKLLLSDRTNIVPDNVKVSERQLIT